MYYTGCLAIIVAISTWSSVWAEVVQTEEPLTDIQTKVNDLWLHILHTKPYLKDNEGIAYTTCNLKPSSKLDDSDLKITGQVLFKQVYPNGKLEAIFMVDGFPLDVNQSARAIHIHNFGDLTDGCDSAGGHYNPFSVNHPHHPGDFGNFRVKDGKIQKQMANIEATLFGPESVIGRSVVVHQQVDDLGRGNNQASLDNGNAGKRLACCVIGFSSRNNWDKYMEVAAALKNTRTSRKAKATSRNPKQPTKA
ncbi:extracellular superoxide dismutase [Cu-Zn] [Discoglossus pictus]